MSDYPRLVLSDEKGKIYVHPELLMLGSNAASHRLLLRREIVGLPKASTLFFMPGHVAVGYDDANKCEVMVSEYAGKKVFPVAAFPIPGYTRLLLPAAKKFNHDFNLPLWPYTAVGWQDARFVISAVQIDKRSRQRPHYYCDRTLLKKNIKVALAAHPRNRLFRHLSHCALTYNCRAAQNLFFRRWEAPLPTAPSCNARCLGCLSLQESDCDIASHQRINFVPSVAEIKEVALFHLCDVREAIVSFGQGCEGEPLLNYKRLRDAILEIRQATSKGTIHLNTNAYNSDALAELADAGLQSIRVSLNSVHADRYEAYYRPRSYKFSCVLRAIKVAKKKGLFVAVNLLVFPGVSDLPSEVKRLIALIQQGNIDYLQMRNLCIDQEFYVNALPRSCEEPIGVLKMIAMITKAAPRLRFGYFNLPKELFHNFR